MSAGAGRAGHRLWLRAVLPIVVLSGFSSAVLAQESSENSATQSQDLNPVVLVVPSYSQSVALLGTDQRYMDLATLQARRRTFLVYGMGVSDSYINNFQENLSSQDSQELVWNSHIALINASNHSSFTIQYAPSVTRTISGTSTDQVFQAGTIAFGEPIARNLFLQLSSANSYGTDFSRLLSPVPFSVNGGVPVATPSSAIYQFNRGKVFTTDEAASLSWQRSPSQSLNFSVQGSYFSVLDNGENSYATLGQISYSAAISRSTSFNVGGNYRYQAFSLGSCSGYGFNVGISHQFGRYLDLSFSGGPEFQRAPCNKGLGANYGISISYPLSRRSRVALAAGRSYMTNYLPNAQWTDSATVGYGRQLSEYFQINVNSGYARSVLKGSSVGAYVGYFAGAEFSWQMSRTIALGTEYRRFAQVSGGPILGQNVGMISLRWNPMPTRIVK